MINVVYFLTILQIITSAEGTVMRTSWPGRQLSVQLMIPFTQRGDASEVEVKHRKIMAITTDSPDNSIESRKKRTGIIKIITLTYESWNFNFGNAAVIFDTAHLQSSYFHRPSIKICSVEELLKKTLRSTKDRSVRRRRRRRRGRRRRKRRRKEEEEELKLPSVCYSRSHVCWLTQSYHWTISVVAVIHSPLLLSYL
jgi:hypothetical protein